MRSVTKRAEQTLSGLRGEVEVVEKELEVAGVLPGEEDRQRTGMTEAAKAEAAKDKEKEMGRRVEAAAKRLEEEKREGRQLQKAVEALRAEAKGFDGRYAAAQAAVRREEARAVRERVGSAEAQQGYRIAVSQMRRREGELVARQKSERFVLQARLVPRLLLYHYLYNHLHYHLH